MKNDLSRAIAGLLVMGAAGFFSLPATAQSFSLGADFVSRYVWRGTDFGESASIQPGLSFTSGAFTIGSWANYSLAADGAGANEHDLFLSLSLGQFSLGVTDYYFPNSSPDFFNFDGDAEGSHWIEPFVGFTGPESFPISLFAGVFVHNDPDNSVYLEAQYPFSLNGTSLTLTAGVVPMESAFYATEGFAVTNLGISASHEVQFTDRFSLPVSVSYILNPDAERSYLVFGISL